MLTFYPEFEADPAASNEIVIMVDCSNSMKVCMRVEIVLSIQLPHSNGWLIGIQTCGLSYFFLRYTTYPSLCSVQLIQGLAILFSFMN